MLKEKIKRLVTSLFKMVLVIFIITFAFETKIVIANEISSTKSIKKISKDFTNKFCNSIAFGLSKESAMNFSIEENKKTFEKRKIFNGINRELLAEAIAVSVVENCGYPIDLSGEKGIEEFKDYYLLKDIKSS